VHDLAGLLCTVQGCCVLVRIVRRGLAVDALIRQAFEELLDEDDVYVDVCGCHVWISSLVKPVQSTVPQ
jgi:hypothetical protein